MSFENAKISWSVKQLCKMVDNGRINLDHIIQRTVVWNKAKKSLLIHSLMISFPVPQIFAKRDEELDESSKKNNTYYIMDGKQRLYGAIYQYVKGEYSLTELPPVTYVNDTTNEECTIDVSGKRFDELPEELQDTILSSTISVCYFPNLIEPTETAELFRRLNNGQGLSAKSRTLSSCQNLYELLDIGSHDIFSEMLSEKARANKNQIPLVMKIWTMLNMSISEISFESRIFNPMLEQKEHIPDEEVFIMNTVMDYALDTYEVLMNRKEKKLAKKMFRETHFVSLIPFFKLASDSEISENEFADWVHEFFNVLDRTSIDENYNQACLSGVSKTESICVRHEALEKSYENFFAISDILDEIEQLPEEHSEEEREIEEVSEGLEPESEEVSEMETVDEISEEKSDESEGNLEEDNRDQESVGENPTPDKGDNELQEDEQFADV